MQSAGRDKFGFIRRAVKQTALLMFVLLFFLGAGREVRAKSVLWKFGDQLSGLEKVIYEGLEEKADVMQNYSVNKPLTISLGRKVSYSEFQNTDCYLAQKAFLMDYTEVFWVAGISMSYVSYDGSSLRCYPIDYYSGVRDDIAGTQKAIRAAVKQIGKYSGRYAKVKAIHDFVVGQIRYASDDLWADFYHTVTGALLSKYDYKGVCEAYAKLFDILCKANGIPSVIYFNEYHMWNYVQMDDSKWYLVDTTWDDPIMVGAPAGTQVLRHDYFLVGTETVVGGQKAGVTHNPEEGITTFEYESGRRYSSLPLKPPKISKKSYSRSQSTAAAKKKVTSVRLDSSSEKLAAGKKLTLKATVLPKDADNRAVTWSSSNSSYASVSSGGVVTAKPAGIGKTVTITAKAKDGSGKKAVCRIRIMKGVVQEITLKGASSVKAGKKLQLKASVKATNGANKTLLFTSSNTKYATVTKKGVVKALAAGKGKTVKITAWATDGSGKKASIKIKIK